MTAEEAKAAPDASYVTQLKGGGRSYSVYVYRCGFVWFSLLENVKELTAGECQGAGMGGWVTGGVWG